MFRMTTVPAVCLAAAISIALTVAFYRWYSYMQDSMQDQPPEE